MTKTNSQPDQKPILLLSQSLDFWSTLELWARVNIVSTGSQANISIEKKMTNIASLWIFLASTNFSSEVLSWDNTRSSLTFRTIIWGLLEPNVMKTLTWFCQRRSSFFMDSGMLLIQPTLKVCKFRVLTALLTWENQESPRNQKRPKLQRKLKKRRTKKLIWMIRKNPIRIRKLKLKRNLKLKLKI